MGLDTILDDDVHGAHNAFSISQKPDTILLHDHHELEGNSEKKSSNMQASFTLFKVFVGSGILALPASFANVGFALGILGILWAGYLTYYCLNLLLQVVQDMKSTSALTLQTMTDRVLGRWGKLSVEISLIIMQAGIGVAILIFSTQFLNHLICDFNINGLCDNKMFLAGAALIVVIPLSFINNLHYFYIPSLMATFFVFVNLIVQTVINFQMIAQQDSSAIYARMTQFDFTNLPLFSGVATYAFEGIGVIFSVRSSMQKPQYFQKILQIQMLLISFLYAFFPGTSELAFGETVPGIILFSLPNTNYFYLLIQILYVVSALLGYPVQLFPVINILENSLGIKKSDEEQETKRKQIYRVGVRLGLIAIMLFVALVAKSFNLFINLMGSGVFTYLGYLLPIIIYHSYFRGRVSKLSWIFNMTAFTIGSVLGVLGIVISIQNIIDYQSS